MKGLSPYIDKWRLCLITFTSQRYGNKPMLKYDNQE